MDEPEPRITSVFATFFRKGRCETCGKHGAERTRSFSGPTLAECERQAAEWKKTPLQHKRCEFGMAMPRKVEDVDLLGGD